MPIVYYLALVTIKKIFLSSSDGKFECLISNHFLGLILANFSADWLNEFFSLSYKKSSEKITERTQTCDQCFEGRQYVKRKFIITE
jgi:hypothetical protein